MKRVPGRIFDFESNWHPKDRGTCEIAQALALAFLSTDFNTAVGSGIGDQNSEEVAVS
jgi:hypothetical protein